MRDGEPRTSTSTFTQLLSSGLSVRSVQCCFTLTETVRTVRNRGHLDLRRAPELWHISVKKDLASRPPRIFIGPAPKCTQEMRKLALIGGRRAPLTLYDRMRLLFWGENRWSWPCWSCQVDLTNSAKWDTGTGNCMLSVCVCVFIFFI